jgi:hypothetical protein
VPEQTALLLAWPTLARPTSTIYARHRHRSCTFAARRLRGHAQHFGNLGSIEAQQGTAQQHHYFPMNLFVCFHLNPYAINGPCPIRIQS